MTNQPTQEYWNNWKKYIKNWSSLRTSDNVGWIHKFELKKFQRIFFKVIQSWNYFIEPNRVHEMELEIKNHEKSNRLNYLNIVVDFISFIQKK